MSVTKYQVIQKPEWSCPGMVIWVDDTDLIIGIQQNPENGSTYEDVEDRKHYFDESDYAYVEEVAAIKTIAEIKANYESLPKSA